ncbi:glycosyltransferase family 4 protein [Rufibacter glacialis]|uniref:Glycosyltransferase family 4 protein n=1 Tax=Rufibacter glacialis TaxID=1259555 RepID=A0A5M8QN24_9BACT|nr:glycosyltransferase family 4 protein [Rufibacter glacialis]KAA6437617.1 glycosyltransferase family 4 protein [Rufibacter glacialis]GGK57789.1 glycosyl transferase [Rufibacter glacialis]
MEQNILFVVPYPSHKAPSQRFRFEQYLDILNDAGYTYDTAPFLDASTWDILYKPGHTLPKVSGIVKGFLRRLILLFKIQKYKFIFIHREATPIGLPWFEWIVAKVLKKKIIYDFDDAIWMPNTSEANKIVAGLKWHHKVGQICQWAYKVSCGNTYLQTYARKFNSESFVIPTTIDTVGHHNRLKEQENEPVVIGWTGTHSTMKYLETIVPVLKKLEEKYSFLFLVISNKEPVFQLKSLRYLPWNKDSEIEDLLRMNIGVMPLVDDQWAKGKCAFKALQYMALGIPALVSPVGMNTEVVDHGINGFICDEPSQWYSALEELLVNSSRRIELGKEARMKIESTYAVTANRLNFLGLFR